MYSVTRSNYLNKNKIDN